MLEEWRPIPGYEGSFEASNLGRIKSLARLDCRGRRIRERILKGTPNAAGYFTVKFPGPDGRQKTMRVHQLVALAFLGPRPNGLLVLHGDGNNQNNAISNLRYGTSSENAQDALRHGTQSNGCRDKKECLRGHKLRHPNLMAYAARRTWRSCMACSNAKSAKFNALYRHGVRWTEEQFLADANERYKKIMSREGEV